MTSNGLTFHHPIAFWSGTLALVAGVLAHIPMFVCASHMGYRMAGMPMDAPMLAGMALIPLGLALAAYGLMPHFRRLRTGGSGDDARLFAAADGIPLNRHHWSLVLVLVVALTIDVMKPATLGFVMPGMTGEYGLSKQNAGFLALVALTGTTVGSVIWGMVADRFGRRATILLSALMFIGTAICGAMPSFGWNLAMCFLMGASAGGLLPITFTLMAETIPAAHRGWLLVALGGIGNSAGYLVAAGAASLLEPSFSWRVLWLLGLPTGAVIILLSRLLPESPRFLANNGLQDEARAVLARFDGSVRGSVRDAARQPAESAAPAPTSSGLRELLRGGYAPLTLGMGVAGVAWGLANFGFLLWLPMNLRAMGMDAATATSLLARAAFLALPGTVLVIWLYHRWSSVGTLVAFIALSAASLLAFFVLGWMGIASSAALAVATCALLVSVSGVIATLIPYASEIYPVHLRATGAGLIAASSKLGGILGAGLGVAGLFADLQLSALAIAVPMLLAALLLARRGIDTRGRRLEEIQALVA
ncbi:MFS transporter [Massilia sp. LXY-6]|uniref:MFS transporter n=1 Tax=Massilia sp. LXY-6 TaxID=3379823 RepID=UPI003EE12591